MEKILFVPHPKLRQHSQTIDKVTEKEILISKEMIEIMKRAPGVGLAANQIGILQKIITVNIQDYEKATEKGVRDRRLKKSEKCRKMYNYTLKNNCAKSRNTSESCCIWRILGI